MGLTRRVYQRDQSLFKVNICMARICTSTVMVTSLCTLIFAGTFKWVIDDRTKEDKYTGLNRNLTTAPCDDSARSNKPVHLQYIDLVASIAEWLMTACMVACLCLYTFEFKAFQNVKIVLLTPEGPLRRASRTLNSHDLSTESTNLSEDESSYSLKV